MAHGVAALARAPGVAPDRIGVTGYSLGGDLAITVAALCPRVRALVAQGLGEAYDYDGRFLPVRADHRDLIADPCWVVPAANAYTWFEDRYLLIAPRPMLLVHADADVGDMLTRGNWLLERLRRIYTVCGAPTAFDARVEHGRHQYFVDPALGFFAAWL